MVTEVEDENFIDNASGLVADMELVGDKEASRTNARIVANSIALILIFVCRLCKKQLTEWSTKLQLAMRMDDELQSE